MGIFQNITNLFKSTDAKLERISVIEFELEQIDEVKGLLSEQYNDISKALCSDEFLCKDEVKFSDIDYMRQLAQLKSREKSFLKELDILKSNEDVLYRLEDKKRLEAVKIIKSLYREGKLGLAQYNEVAAEKDEEGATKYADVIVINNQNEFLLLKRSTFEDKHQGAWVIPGGHVDAGEDFECAAKRELLEESGISVDKLYQNEKITGVTWYHVGTYTDKDAHIEYYCLNIQDAHNIEILLDELESRDYKWVPIEEVDNYPMVFNMKENVKEVMGWDAHAQVKVIEKADANDIEKAFNTISQLYVQGQISDELFNAAEASYIEKSEKLKGGKGDSRTDIDIADRHGVSTRDIEDEVTIGMEIELEHTDDPKIAAEIVRDHLWEIPDYYTRLVKMESDAKKEQSNG